MEFTVTKNLFEGYGPANPLVMSGAGLCKYPTPEAIKVYADAADLTVIGSITPGDVREGNPGTKHDNYENPLYSVNAWGMNNEGSNRVAANAASIPAKLRSKVIVSVAGFSAQDYVDLYSSLWNWGVGIELNLGCPNVRDKVAHAIASFDLDYLAAILQAVSALAAAHPTMVGVKLSPYTDPGLLAEVAAVINEADFVNYVASTNTIPNCRAFIYRSHKHEHAILIGPDNNIHKGGAGGPALKPLSLMNAEDFRDKLRDNIAVVRVGGVSEGEDIWQSYEVGAIGTQIVTAAVVQGPAVFTKVRQQYADIIASKSL